MVSQSCTVSKLMDSCGRLRRIAECESGRDFRKLRWLLSESGDVLDARPAKIGKPNTALLFFEHKATSRKSVICILALTACADRKNVRGRADQSVNVLSTTLFEPWSSATPRDDHSLGETFQATSCIARTKCPAVDSEKSALVPCANSEAQRPTTVIATSSLAGTVNASEAASGTESEPPFLTATMPVHESNALRADVGPERTVSTESEVMDRETYLSTEKEPSVPALGAGAIQLFPKTRSISVNGQVIKNLTVKQVDVLGKLLRAGSGGLSLSELRDTGVKWPAKLLARLRAKSAVLASAIQMAGVPHGGYRIGGWNVTSASIA